MKKHLLLASLLAGTLAVTGLSACGSDSTDSTGTKSGDSGAAKSDGNDTVETKEPVKAAWIYIGPINDGGWTQAHDKGRLAVEAAMGGQVKTSYKENVPEGTAAATVIDDLVKDGNKIIFAASFGYRDAMLAAAKKYPDVKFEHATGIPDASLQNFSTYFGAGEESLYLAGMAAGGQTKKNLIGFVAPFPIPEVVRHINAYALGAQSVNPEAKIKVVWVSSWLDPAKERQAAESLIKDGADVIASGGDSPAPGDAALAAKVGWTGYDSDQSFKYPDVWLTAAIYDWGVYYTKEVKAVADGTWKKGDYYGNIADGFTTIATYGTRMTQEQKAAIDSKKDSIAGGVFKIFAGPITDQSGKERVPASGELSIGDQMGINWFVKGIEGTLPKS